MVCVLPFHNLESNGTSNLESKFNALHFQPCFRSKELPISQQGLLTGHSGKC